MRDNTLSGLSTAGRRLVSFTSRPGLRLLIVLNNEAHNSLKPSRDNFDLSLAAGTHFLNS